jgi:hypothetical protein
LPAVEPIKLPLIGGTVKFLAIGYWNKVDSTSENEKASGAVQHRRRSFPSFLPVAQNG